LVVQHWLPSRQLFCLTSWGLHTIVKIRPIQLLQQALLARSQSDINQLQIEYGPDEFCAM